MTGQTGARTARERQKLVNRARRIGGQLAAVEALIGANADCERALHVLAACRGAVSALMAEILEDHILHQVVGRDAHRDSEEFRAAEQLIDIIRSYLR
jgi:DNA-binding FrmR family transcriptional regulator